MVTLRGRPEKPLGPQLPVPEDHRSRSTTAKPASTLNARSGESPEIFAVENGGFSRFRLGITNGGGEDDCGDRGDKDEGGGELPIGGPRARENSPHDEAQRTDEGSRNDDGDRKRECERDRGPAVLPAAVAASSFKGSKLSSIRCKIGYHHFFSKEWGPKRPR